MARDDLFRRSFEAGTAFLDMTREKAEALVKELVKAGEVKKGKASKLIDEVLERSRRGTEELVQIIRREIGEQVSALGLATKDDLADLERRMAGGATTEPATTTPSAAEPATAAAAEPAREVPPVVGSVPGAAAPAPEAPDRPAGGEAQVTGARAAAAGAQKAAKARAPRKKAAGSAPPPADRPAGGGSGG